MDAIEAEARKARGAFFTPARMSEFITEWAVRTPRDVVLEPSSGEAAFLLAAGRRLDELGRAHAGADQLHGAELHGDSAAHARRHLQAEGFDCDIQVGDFFDARFETGFDAVIGNPPYVRYQQHTGEMRVKSRVAALAQGVNLTGLASSWAAFVVHAASMLNEGGRMGLVLPGELLTVNYASEVREYLLRRFASVKLVAFEELVFPGALEEVVLLLAEGEGGCDHFELVQLQTEADLKSIDELVWTKGTAAADGKWSSSFVSAEAETLYRELLDGERFAEMTHWGRTYLGAVSGNNKYFTLSRDDAHQAGLSERDVIPLSPPGSKHLRGLGFTQAAWEELAANGSRAYLFHPGDEPSDAAQRYIRKGKRAKVDQAYKCKVRSPWHRVPLVDLPDAFITCMNHDTPRLVSNDAKVQFLNSVHGVKFYAGFKKLGMGALPIAALNTMTMLGAELVGRAYGGGLLKVEPREAARIPMPTKDVVAAVEAELRALKPQLGTALRGGDLEAVVAQVDRLLLTKHLKLTRKEVKALQVARTAMFDRRRARGKGIPE